MSSQDSPRKAGGRPAPLSNHPGERQPRENANRTCSAAGKRPEAIRQMWWGRETPPAQSTPPKGVYLKLCGPAMKLRWAYYAGQ